MPTQSAMPELVSCRMGKESGIWSLIRLLEVVSSVPILVLLSPLMVLAAAAIAVLSRRSPMVAHLRIGQFGAPFWTLKFRSMWGGGAAVTARPRLIEYIVDDGRLDYKPLVDPRVTSEVARFCRRFSIDELPQLVNVLRGEMSLVGPRPLTEGELKKYYGADAAEVLLVKPGITGLWQVMGRSRLSFERRRELDLQLVRQRSLNLYLRVLMRTIPAVVKGKDGW